MNQKLLFIILVAAAAVGVSIYLYRSPLPPGIQTGAPQAAPPSGPVAVNRVIAMTPEGFSPAELAIKVGETVLFRNDDTRSRWPASGIHPTHLLCPGFDALQPLPPGAAYSYIFMAAKECPFHDHLTTSLRGKITVTE